MWRFGSILNYQLVPHTIRKFWKMIVNKASQIHAIRNAAQQMNLYSHRHWQILDRRNRRKQTDFCAENPIEKSFNEHLQTWAVGRSKPLCTHFNCIRNRNPLGCRGIASSGIVCASMKQNNRSISCIFQIIEHSIDVHWTRFWIPIAIWTNVFESGSCKDSFVIFCELLHTHFHSEWRKQQQITITFYPMMDLTSIFVWNSILGIRIGLPCTMHPILKSFEFHGLDLLRLLVNRFQVKIQRKPL